MAWMDFLTDEPTVIETVLGNLSPEQRLEGFPADDVFRVLSAEQRERFRQLLNETEPRG